MSLKKQLLMIPLVAVMAAGCVQSDSPILILNYAVRNEACEPQQGIYQASGSLNLTYDVGYNASFWVESNFQPLTTEVGDDLIVGPEQNDFIAERIDVTYSSPTGANVPPAITIPYYVTIRAGARMDENTIGMNLLPDASRTALAGVGLQGATVVAEFQMHGHLRSGTPVSSNVVSYPIHVYEGPAIPSCPAGYLPVGECGSIGGQDGWTALCAEDTSGTP